MASLSPKLFLRQHSVIDITKSWKPGSFLEVGAGTGIMTNMFLSREFFGCCYDLSPESREILKNRLMNFDDRIKVLENLKEISPQSFDYLLAFEVLEHIEDDLQSLKYWSQFLKRNAKIIVSVPAHKNKFSEIDELVGHVRSYEKDELFDLLDNAGYKNIKIINYGYPLSELSRHISKKILKDDNPDQLPPIRERNLKSSYSRPTIISNYLSKIPQNAYMPFRYIQRIFYNFDLGDGLIAIADKA